MGEALRNSFTVTFTSNWLAYCPEDRIYHLGSQCLSSARTTNRRYIRLCSLNLVSMPVKGHSCFGNKLKRPKIIPQFEYTSIDYSVNVSNMVASIETSLLSEEEEDENLIQRGKEHINSKPSEENLPPWGNLLVDRDPDLKPESRSQMSMDMEGKVTVVENKVHFLEEMDEEILSRRILMLSRCNKVRTAMEMYRSMKFLGLRPNVHACNSFLSCLLRNGLHVDALKVFEFMKTNDITTGHTYSLILKAIADTEGYDSALDMFTELERDCVQKQYFDVIVYNTVISLCGRENNWVETERIWREMRKNGHLGSKVTYSLLISIFVRNGQNELALNAYNEMIQNGLKPEDDSMQAVISACAKEGNWDSALIVFQKMLNTGLKPSEIACNALINLLGKAGKVKLAFKIFGIMKTLGHSPDYYTWNALLSGLYRANRHADALQLFERIKSESSQLNVHLYNTALMSCQKLGSWEKAVQLLWQMEASGLSVSASSYNLVLGACETARKPKVALQVYEHLVHQKCTPDVFTHLSLIRSCIWGSLWSNVEDILDQAEPDASLYNAAIQGMCLRGKLESAKKLYLKMRKTGLQPDGKTRALMLQNLKKDPTKRNRSSNRPGQYSK